MFWHPGYISITLLAMNSLVISLKLEGKSYLILIMQVYVLYKLGNKKIRSFYDNPMSTLVNLMLG